MTDQLNQEQPKQQPKMDGLLKLTLLLLGITAVCSILYLTMCSAFKPSSDKVDATDEPYNKVMLMSVTEDYVMQFLVSPSSAEFPGNSSWIITDNGSVITVKSYVDSQNRMGAMLRSNFTARYSLPSVNLIYLDIDGEVMYSK